MTGVLTVLQLGVTPTAPAVPAELVWRQAVLVMRAPGGRAGRGLATVTAKVAEVAVAWAARGPRSSVQVAPWVPAEGVQDQRAAPPAEPDDRAGAKVVLAGTVSWSVASARAWLPVLAAERV